ncbi:MAG: ABC transporter substrate-binding protein [Dehalococcoidia bacterium]
MTARYSRRRALGLGAGLVGAVLLGCTGEDEPTGPAADPSGRIRVRTWAAPTPEATAPASPRPPMTLTLGATAEEAAATGGLGRVGRFVTYSRLVGFDPRNASVYGDLAREVELPEPLTVRITLRDRVHFHPNADGVANPLTAHDVVAEVSHRRGDGVFLFTDVIESAEASSDTDLVLRLRAPFSLLFEFLARPDAAIRGRGRYTSVDASLGSGPFMPLRREETDLVFGVNPLLEDAARPRLSNLRVRTLDQPADLDSEFAQGGLDVREHPDAQSRQAASARTARIEASRPRQRMRGLALSLLAPRDQASQATVEAFRDTRVRRALSLALDRAGLSALDGGVVSGPVGPAFGGDALPRAELESHPLYQHNAQGALALLRAAGQDGLAVRIAHADTAQMLPSARAVADQLAAAGFTPRLVARPQAEFQAAFLAGDFEAAFFELDRLTTPDIGLRLHTTGGLDGQRSPWGYSNPVYDAAVRETLSEIDPVLRTRRSREAQRLLLDDVPAMLPISAPLEYASMSGDVAGYEFDAYDFNAGVLSRQWEGPRAPSAGRAG